MSSGRCFSDPCPGIHRLFARVFSIVSIIPRFHDPAARLSSAIPGLRRHQMPSSIVCKPRPTTTTQTSAAPFWPPARARVTHLARKALPMRHKISSQHLNPLKQRGLKPHDYELHTPQDASPAWHGRLKPRFLSVFIRGLNLISPHPSQASSRRCRHA